MSYRGMTQQEVNNAEWRNEKNWRGRWRWFSVYYSKRDTRAWVPKRDTSIGMTVNFARRAGVVTTILLLGLGLGGAFVALFIAMR